MDFLEKVERQLDLPPAEKSQVMRELKSHYEEMRDQLIASGTDPAVVEAETAQKMGEPGDIAARLSVVHNRASWKSALLAAAPFALPILALTLVPTASRSWNILGMVLLGVFGVILFILGLRQLLHGWRPVWLATWLAGMLGITFVLSPYLPVISRSLHVDYIRLAPYQAAGMFVFFLSAIVWAGLALWCRSSWRTVMITVIILFAANVVMRHTRHG